jgi:O-antigen/teichoic acid export membrane protein
LKRRLIDLIKFFGIKIFGVIFSSLIIFYLQKKYGNSIQGYYGVLTNYILLLTIFSQFGLPSYISLQLSYYKKSNIIKTGKIVNDYIKTLLYIQPIIFVIVLILLYYLKLSFFEILIIYLTVLVNVFIYFYSYVLRGMNNFGWMIFFTETSRWVLIFMIVLIFENYFSIEDIILYALFLSSILTFGFSYFRVKYIGFNSFDWFSSIKINRIKNTLLKSSTLMTASFGALCFQQMNVIQLSYYKPMEDVGIFNFTFKYLSFTILPVSVLVAKYAQVASGYYFQREIKRLKKTFFEITLLSFILTILAIIILYYFSNSIYSYVNQSFDLNLFILLSISMLFFSLFGFWVSFLEMIKKSKEATLILFTGIIINIIVSYFVTPYMSYLGIAISYLVSSFVCLIICVFYLNNFFKFKNLN